MIRSFRRKGSRKFFETGSVAGIHPRDSKRLRMQLGPLDTALSIEDVDITGFRPHRMKGKDRGGWSIWVNGNWRSTFEFVNGDVHVPDYEDCR